ncbi:MAG: hypothetical protein ACO3EG_07395, partial [Chitinophagaceae bacterium]
AAAPAPEPAPEPAQATGPKNRDSMTFGQAFNDARKSKENIFPWRGKQYTTQLTSNKVSTQPGQKSAYVDPDVGGAGAQNAGWLNQKFPKAQVGQEYWVRGTRYEKKADGWYRSFEKGDWFGKAVNHAASRAGYTGPADDKSMQAWAAKNRPAQPAPQQIVSPEEIPTYESKESSGYDEIQRLVSLIHHR